MFVIVFGVTAVMVSVLAMPVVFMCMLGSSVMLV